MIIGNSNHIQVIYLLLESVNWASQSKSVLSLFLPFANKTSRIWKIETNSVWCCLLCKRPESSERKFLQLKQDMSWTWIVAEIILHPQLKLLMNRIKAFRLKCCLMSQIEILSLTHYSEHRYQQLREIYITTKDGCFNTSCCFYFVVMHQRQNE